MNNIKQGMECKETKNHVKQGFANKKQLCYNINTPNIDVKIQEKYLRSNRTTLGNLFLILIFFCF